MPADFPSDDYDAIVSVCDGLDMAHRNANNQQPSPVWRQFTAASNSIVYRWSGLDVAAREFERLYPLTMPSAEQRNLEETALFSFFTNGLSVIECTFFGVYAALSLVSPNKIEFNLDEKKVPPPDAIVGRLSSQIRDHKVTSVLKTVQKSKAYKAVKNMRDILSHRGSPPRNWAIQPPRIIGVDPPLPRAESTWQGLTLNVALIAELRQQLSDSLRAIFESAREYLEKAVVK
jgi:hypothetical protein